MSPRTVVAFALALQLVAIDRGIAQGAVSKSAVQSGTAKAPSTAMSNAVVAQEQAVLDAIARADTVGYNKALGRDFVYVDHNGATRWQLSKTSTMFQNCGLGTGWTLDHPMTTEVGPDLVVLTYTSSGKSVCNGRPAPSPVNSMSVWQHRNGRWVAIAHSETPAAPSQAKP
jgi:hypothetical protein